MENRKTRNPAKDNMGADTILFRVDTNPSIGFGHVMRCLSIADAAVSLHLNAIFILADNAGQELVTRRGYQTVILGSSYTELDGETEKVSSVIAEISPKVLIIDSYFVTERYLNIIWNKCRSTGSKLVYIDDILSFPYPCDVLLNYGIYGAKEDYKNLYKGTDHFPNLLLGPSFAPLRQEFQNVMPRIIRKQGKDILCSTGGSDSAHMTLALAAEIQRQAISELTFHLIIGAMNEDKALIYERTEDTPNIVLHENVQNMSILMQSFDVAISAAGSTLYELCVTQTPTIIYILADNQIPGAEGFERCGVMKCAGDVRQLGAEALAGKLVEAAIELCENYNERVRIAEKMSEMTDGQGTKRIVKAII